MVTASDKSGSEAIAIIGMAGRFPGATSVAELWRNLCEGIESISFSTDEELISAGVKPEQFRGTDYVRAGGNIKDADLFDASFFNLNAREAEIIDPQHRIFLECCWDCFEDAAYDPYRISGSVGVFAGAGMNTYGMINLLGNEALMSGTGGYQLMVGNDKDFLATRVAYKLNLRGPAISVQTACSTSLVAVQMAFESLRRGECDMAVAGGVSIIFPQESGYQYVPGMILSPDGHCRTFDAKAAGTVPGRGAGAVLLKRLQDAITDGDHIYAVIRGAAINNDGAAKVGYSAPSVEGQSRVIARSMQMADFEPSTIRYVEAHGTGTEIGDPVEVRALTEAFGTLDGDKQFCALGSIKTNIGHLDTAAGVTGLIKAALAVRHRLIPPTLHYQAANPLIPFDRSPFFVPTTLLPYTGDEPFRVGVSSFGIGGTNAHVSLEERQAVQSSSDSRPQLLVLSARSDAALNARCTALEQYLGENPEISLPDVAWTLQDGRHAFRHRKAIIAKSTEDARSILAHSDSPLIRNGIAALQEKEAFFLFTGQGAQYANMGRGLYESIPVFRNAIDTCCDLLLPILDLDLRTVLYPPSGSEAASDTKLAETWITQPALFVIEYATAQLYLSCGIKPAAMLGHSVGEFAAACVANIFSLQDALQLIALRGKLVYSMPQGAMVAISLPESSVTPLLSAEVSVAAVNTSSQTVVSGPFDAIAALEQALGARGIETRRLRTSHAFHSAMLDPIVESFRDAVSKIARKVPTVPILSNLTGTWITDEEAVSPDYWARHLRHAVRFADCAAVVAQHQDWIVVEVGPGETLLSFLRQAANTPSQQTLISSIRQPRVTQDDYEFWLTALSRMWIAGTKIEWSGLHSPNARLRLSLPGYPFERQRYWVNPTVAPTGSSSRNLTLDKQSDIADWFYFPTWQRSRPLAALPPEPLSQGNVYLILGDTEPGSIKSDIIDHLAQNGAVVQAIPSDTFSQQSLDDFTLSPQSREHWSMLLEALLARGQWPHRILHMLSLDADREETLEVSLERTFFSSMALVQAIGDISFTRSVSLSFITSQSYSVAGEPVSNPMGASLSGFAKVLGVESPNFRCNIIDIDPIDEPSTLAALVQEIQTSPEGDVIALRRNTRWTQQFEATRIESPSVAAVHLPSKSRTYLITGGLGGLGLVFAEELARSEPDSHFVLISRSTAPPEEQWESMLADEKLPSSEMQRVRGLLNIRAAGGTITTLQADVSDTGRMREIVSWCNEKLDGIRGVIHAAGIPSQSMILTKKREEALKVFQAKLQGTAWIEELLASTPPVFVLLCSSISAILPSPGLADYATANAYLDAFASQFDDPQGPRVISVNWDTWADVGMAVDVAHQRGSANLNELAITHAITSEEGASALHRVLSFPSSEVLVSTRDFGLLLKYVREQATNTATHDPNPTSSIDLHPRPNLSQSYVEAADDTERAICGIWCDLLGIDSVGRYDNFFELGGHSLLGTQVMARIRQRFGLDLPLRTVFEASTPAAMASVLQAIPWASGINNDDQTTSIEREEIEL